MSKALLKFIDSVCVQDAWLWDITAATADGYGGHTWPDGHPVRIKCRWDDVVERITAADGEEVVSNAQLLVTQDVPVGSYLQLEPSDTATAPLDTNGARIARLSARNPLFRSTNDFVRTVYLC